MKAGLTDAMHEDPRSTDVSHNMGPMADNANGHYFHVLEKGGRFSGMCPSFEFVNDSIMVTLAFGRAETSLLLLRITDTISLLDALDVPGRGTKVW